VTQVLALPELGLVDADQGYAAHVLLATGLGDVVLDAPPQLLGQRTRSIRADWRTGKPPWRTGKPPWRTGKPPWRTGKPPWRTGKPPWRTGKPRASNSSAQAAALARPRHAHLSGLAAGLASHPRHLGMQPAYSGDRDR